MVGARTPRRGRRTRGGRRTRCAAPFALSLYLKSLGPLDLMSARNGSTLVVDRDGRLLRPFTMPNGRWRLPATHTQVDPRYLAMLIAYEDGRFRSHDGVDFWALGRAAWQMATHGRIVSGASTLTMQVARLMEPRERSLSAKIRQMARAWQIERKIGKDGVLDRYLTLAPFGGNLEGARAASLAYFGKEPRRLTYRRGGAAGGAAAGARGAPAGPARRRRPRRPRACAGPRGRARRHRRARSRRGQRRADPGARRAFPALAAHAAEEAVAADTSVQTNKIVDRRPLAAEARSPRQGARRAARRRPVGRHRRARQRQRRKFAPASARRTMPTPRATARSTCRIKPRSPGSALKPFIYAMAFEQGLAHPETILFDRPARYGAYAPENFDLGYQGPVTARRALQQSLNLPAIELLAAIGPNPFLARLHGAGATVALPKDTPIGLAIGLGGLGVSLVDLARLYAGLARGGEAPALYRAARRRAGARAGATRHRRRRRPTMSRTFCAARRRRPTRSRAASPSRPARPTASATRWRSASTSCTTIAVWVGRPDNGPTPGLIGRETAAPILFDAFARLGRAVEHRPPPPGLLRVVRSAELPPPLRHLRSEAPKTMAATERAALKISFPPDGANVDLGGGGEPLA